MITVKDILDDTGLRSISLVSLLVAGLYLSGSHYLETQATEVRANQEAIRELEARQDRIERYRAEHTRDYAAIAAIVERIRQRLDQHIDNDQIHDRRRTDASPPDKTRDTALGL